MNALRNVELTNVFVVDIETVPCVARHGELDEPRRSLWDNFSGKRFNRDNKPDFAPADHFNQAAIYAEFGKVICISVGYFREDPDGGLRFRVKSFASDDECEVLRGFANLLDSRQPFGNKLPGSTMQTGRGYFLCAHNGREFDYAYLGRRMLICGVPLPPMLDIAGYKPWDLPHLLDTMDMWKFGDMKGQTSLALLAGVFGIPSPKDDIDGSQVGRVYWEEGDLARIVTYCQKDVETTARVLLHFYGCKELWDETRVERIPWRAEMRVS